MTFEERWENIWKASGLPNTARMQIPGALTEKTKKSIAVSKLNDNTLGILFADVVDQINHGSVAGIEELLRNRI